MNIAIDASRNRSGGAVVHITELIKNFKYIMANINELHVWAQLKLSIH